MCPCWWNGQVDKGRQFYMNTFAVQFRQKGKQEGMQQGMRQGMRQGEAQILLRELNQT